MNVPKESATATPAPDMRAPKGRSLRSWGVLALVMFLLTSAVGGSLALESSYLWLTLLSHIGLALVTLGVTGYTASTIGRHYHGLPRASAGLAAFAALGGTIAGTVFLLGNQNNYALYAMEGFAVLGILAALVMMVVGKTAGTGAVARDTDPSAA